MEPIETSAVPTFCAMCGGPIGSYATRIWREGRIYHSDCVEHEEPPDWHRKPYPLAVELKAQIAEANHEAAALRARVAELEAQNETLQSALEMAGIMIEANKPQPVSYDSAMTVIKEPDPRDEQIRRLREALENLLDVQNGPPLVTLAEAWESAVNDAYAALADHAADANNMVEETTFEQKGTES